MTERVERPWRPVRWLLGAGGVALLLAALWLAGLLAFIAQIPDRFTDGDERTDAIVVLTGGSERLQAGLRLLAEKRAGKLLISGVHEGVRVIELLQYLPEPQVLPGPDEIACCVVLGYSADNTAGNARETAQWMAAEGFRSLRLVTAAYHMPRSLLEFRRAMPGIAIEPHPVFPDQVKRSDWWRWPGTFALLVSEYDKYLYALLRPSLGGA